MRKKRKPIDVAVDLFSRVPEVVRVEANIEDDLWERVGVDFKFVVDVDPYRIDLDIARRVTAFMLETGIGATFLVFSSHEEPEACRMVVFFREGAREKVEARRASGEGAA